MSLNPFWLKQPKETLRNKKETFQSIRYNYTKYNKT